MITRTQVESAPRHSRWSTVLRPLVAMLAGLALLMIGGTAQAVATPPTPEVAVQPTASVPGSANVSRVARAVGTPQVDQTFRYGSSGPTTRSGQHAFFGHALPPTGTTLHNVVIIPEKLTAKSITIHHGSAIVTGSSVLEVGTGSHRKTVHTSFTWTSHCHWKFTVEYNASPGHHPAHATGVDLNKVTGSIEASDCVGHVHLTLHGYQIANGTADIRLHATHAGFEGSVDMVDLLVGGISYPKVKLSVSTLSPSARLEGTMETDSGTFTVDTYLTSQTGGYQQHLAITGADLKLETKKAKFHKFHVEKTFTAPTTGCAHFSANGEGSFTIKRVDYDLLKLHIKLECGELKVLQFRIRISHTDQIGVTTSARLGVALMNTPGTTDELTGPGIQTDAIHYSKCLCGYADLSKKKNFEKTIKGHEFHRSIKIGLVMGLAVYTPYSEHPTSDDPVHAMIGAGGYFSADRVSGAFGCIYRQTFTCTGEIRVNPSWAGVYHYEYGLYI